MANYFVDSTTGSDSDNGTTMDLAWATVEHAMESAGLSGENTIWVRRLHNEITIAAIVTTCNSFHSGPIKIVGWPRAADSSITEADWTNGLRTVDNIVGLSMDREKHVGRFVTAPDGRRYMITYIVDSDTVMIDNKYQGATVTSTNGACTIHADEHWTDDMGTEYGFDDSGWIIKETDWDADADDLPTFDFGANAHYFQVASDNIHVHNVHFKNGTSSTGNFYTAAGCGTVVLQGSLLSKVHDSSLLNIASGGVVALDRCILQGGKWNYIYGNSRWTNVAQYASQDHGIVSQSGGRHIWENVNVGVEVANTNQDMYMNGGLSIHGKNVKFSDDMAAPIAWGNGSGTFAFLAHFENFGKVLGVHKIFNGHGVITKLDVVPGSGDPYRRAGGASSVIELEYNLADFYQFTSQAFPITLLPVFEHEFESPQGSRRYRYYVQAEGNVTAEQLWIEVEYISAYDDATLYYTTFETSDEAITVRTGADDWSQYIEVPNISPAIDSKVRIKCYCNYYDASNKIYIDPKPEVTS